MSENTNLRMSECVRVALAPSNTRTRPHPYPLTHLLTLSLSPCTHTYVAHPLTHALTLSLSHSLTLSLLTHMQGKLAIGTMYYLLARMVMEVCACV